MRLPLVHFGEEVLGELEGEGDEVVEGVEDFIVQVFGKGLDLRETFLEELGDWLRDVSVLGCKTKQKSVSMYVIVVGRALFFNHLLAMFHTSVLSFKPPLRYRRPAGRYPL